MHAYSVIDHIPLPLSMRLPYDTAELLRRAILGILLFGLAGTGVELLLLKHTDGFWQWSPLALIALAMAVVAWHALTRGAGSVRALQLLMGLNLASGIVGFAQHFSGNLGYARDSNPSVAGMELYTEALLGSTPTLAPGTMIVLALLGFAYAIRHPSLSVTSTSDESTSTTNKP
ncbi:MAG: hypothetical protein ABIW79_07995 [Gemmatimonas sp.]